MLQQKMRKKSRYSSDIEVSLGNGSSGFVRNISIGGCFIETKTDIKNTFNIPIISFDPLKVVNLQCKVMWSNNTGIGTEFDLNDENRKVLSWWVFVKKVDKMKIEAFPDEEKNEIAELAGAADKTD